MNGLTRRLVASALAIGFASMWLAVPGGAAAAVGPTLGQVEHIVIIVHEGRTFDSVLGRYPGVDGIAVTDQRADMLIDEPPLAADSVAAATAWANGANTGFVSAQQVRGLSAGAPLRVARRALVPATWELAKLGVVGQRAFADVLGGSAANRRALFGYPIPVVSGTVSDAHAPAADGRIAPRLAGSGRRRLVGLHRRLRPGCRSADRARAGSAGRSRPAAVRPDHHGRAVQARQVRLARRIP